MSLQPNTYLLHALTNLHPGSEGTNTGIVDNLVQRDAVTGIPIIHASGMKGSLRELFEEVILKNATSNISQSDINFIFGPNSKSKEFTQGNYKFFQADLLSIPVRSNQRPYFNATSPEILRTFLREMEKFMNPNYKSWQKLLQPLIDTLPALGRPKYFGETHSNLSIDDASYEPEGPIKSIEISNDHRILLGENVVIFHHDDFKHICSKLPVIARNKLLDGESKNLWYEEFVPRESRFWFQILKPTGDSKLDDGLSKANNLFQVGGNASVGFGFCSLTNLNI
jgi:CRISPR-associated protein Cmr4